MPEPPEPGMPSRFSRTRGRSLKLLSAVLMTYLAAYAVLRVARTGTWEHDGRRYVIYPAGARAVYYLFRPVAYLDRAITGTGAHIGPHRPAADAVIGDAAA